MIWLFSLGSRFHTSDIRFRIVNTLLHIHIDTVDYICPIQPQSSPTGPSFGGWYLAKWHRTNIFCFHANAQIFSLLVCLSCLYLLPKPPPLTPPDYVPEQTNKNKAWFTVAVWQRSTGTGVWEGGLGQTVFKFYRMYCNTPTVLTQIHRVSYWGIINCTLPAGISIDLNCLFDNILKECFWNLLLRIDQTNWSKLIQQMLFKRPPPNVLSLCGTDV